MILALQATAPLFTNDIVGLIKILAIIAFTVLLPAAALVVYFLKRGPDASIAELRTEMNGFGGRLGLVERQTTQLASSIESIHRDIAESQRDIMSAIRASAEAQIRAVHLVEIEVAKLQATNNLGDCLAGFGRSIEKLAERINERGGHE